MKILTISNMYPSATDPVYGTFVKNFMDELRKRNHDGINDIVTIYGKRKWIISKLITYTGFYTRLILRLLFIQYDLVYVHTITFPSPGLRIASIFKHHIPLIFNVHGNDVLSSNRLKRILRNISRPLVAKSLAIVSPSAYFKDVLQSEFPKFDKGKIIVSPSGGINTDFFHHKKIVDAHIITLGFVSRIDEKKGWDIFLNAIHALTLKGIKCQGIIAGRGTQVKAMLTLRKKLNLEESVEYIGPIAHNNLPNIYNAFDLFIFPTTHRESLGLVGLEAMASSVPVIASNLGGLTDYVSDTTNGYLFAPGNATDLAAKIMQWQSLPLTDKQHMADKAYLTAQSYEASSVADHLFKQLQNIHSRISHRK